MHNLPWIDSYFINGYTVVLLIRISIVSIVCARTPLAFCFSSSMEFSMLQDSKIVQHLYIKSSEAGSIADFIVPRKDTARYFNHFCNCVTLKFIHLCTDFAPTTTAKDVIASLASHLQSLTLYNWYNTSSIQLPLQQLTLRGAKSYS